MNFCQNVHNLHPGKIEGKSKISKTAQTYAKQYLYIQLRFKFQPKNPKKSYSCSKCKTFGYTKKFLSWMEMVLLRYIFEG